MSHSQKIAWMESQFLYPQHFQQQERYFEHIIEQRARSLSAYCFGFFDLAFAETLQLEGRVALEHARGILSDGCPFNVPYANPLPPPLAVPTDTRDELVYLALPIYQPGQRMVDIETSEQTRSRYRVDPISVFDYAASHGAPETIDCAQIQLQLILGNQPLGGYTCLPIARIREVTAEGAVILDPHYIPPVLHAGGDPTLNRYLNDTIGLLKQRGTLLAQRFTNAQHGSGNTAIADFMLLQLVNRYEPFLRHLSQKILLPPVELFEILLQISGELASFTTHSKRAINFPTYEHEDLYASFQPLMRQISEQLSVVLEQTATPLPVKERAYGIHVSEIIDRTLLVKARFVLGVKADQTTDVLRQQLPRHIKIGGVEHIRDLVMSGLPGIRATPLPIAPREITYHSGFVYFELEQSSEHWKQLMHSGGIAFHVAGNFPNLSLAFWAIKEPHQ
ncbi:MAG: type VI secretion system baseplate subunit TssK [Gammaproteobacteria bacterium]